MSARETAELLLQAGRLVQAEGYDGKLSPAQWMALRYFARANPFSRTPSAFAAFQATTRDRHLDRAQNAARPPLGKVARSDRSPTLITGASR